MRIQLDDLGPQAYGDIWCNWRYARHPVTGADLALGSLANSGFMVIDPRARTGIQVQPEKRFTSGWAIGQGPDGSIYQAGFSSDNSPNALVRWSWEGDTAAVVAVTPCRSLFTLDVAPDGCVYLPEYSANTLYRYRPDTGVVEKVRTFHDFGEHIRNITCGADGMVYLTCVTYPRTQVLAFDPRTGDCAVVTNAEADGWQYGQMIKDAGGRVLAPYRRWGRTFWHELRDGKPAVIDQREVMLAQTAPGGMMPFAFHDGSYIAGIDDDTQNVTITYVDAGGKQSVFTVPRANVPLRIFSLAAGGGRVWGGTFIPLTLFSRDPATGETAFFGRPTPSTGEIYSMIYARDRLYLASYTDAALTRVTPPDGDRRMPPVQLGRMKEDGLPLQRPYGKTADDAGNVYFSARGDYGCVDSGICRIDPLTEEVKRWIYPETEMTALTYLPRRRQLLVAERRQGEAALCATFISPEDGRVLDSLPLFLDNGSVHSWLHDGGDLVYGLYGYHAELFAFSLQENRIVASLPELDFGDHCHECLLFGPDGDIWGLTNRCVYAVSRDLTSKRVVAEYADYAGMNFYRFGMVYGPDGAIYFPNGAHLMRLRATDEASADECSPA